MRIAYIAPYQGPTVVRRRPIVRNRSLACKVKIELIATSLRMQAHDVEIISQGEVVDPELTFYPSFSETELFAPDISVFYASALPIRYLNGIWSNMSTLHLFRTRHRLRPYDLVIVFNMKAPQVTCANDAMRRLGLPVILEYEDDVFVNVGGDSVTGFVADHHHRACKRILREVAGAIAVSPHLLAQFASDVPGLLLPGAVGDDMLRAGAQSEGAKRNRILFSGTHIESSGVVELIGAWRIAAIPNWELHITGYGGLTNKLRDMAQGIPGIVFHGLLPRSDLLRLMCSAKICVNPHALSRAPGNVFAFKIIEYLAAGAHVITTPMGTLEEQIERGITYIPNNDPRTIASVLTHVIRHDKWKQTAAAYVRDAYGTAALASSLDELLHGVAARQRGTPSPRLPRSLSSKPSPSVSRSV